MLQENQKASGGPANIPSLAEFTKQRKQLAQFEEAKVEVAQLKKTISVREDKIEDLRK